MKIEVVQKESDAAYARKLKRSNVVSKSLNKLISSSMDREKVFWIFGIRFQFLSQKPVLYVLNLGENDAARMHEMEAQYRDGPLAGKAQTGVVAVCGKIEAELAELAAEEAQEYLASFGLKESALERMIHATYALLGLMSFLTAGETEVRAWTIPVNSPAAKAAGAIHTDFEKKFIRAEVVNWKHLVEYGGYPGVREKGVLRLEGKEYIVKDGDVLVIRHG